MKDFNTTSITALAGIIADHLQLYGIAVVLVGGLAVEIYTENLYLANDIDMLNTNYMPPKHIHAAMAELGFHKKGSIGDLFCYCKDADWVCTAAQQFRTQRAKIRLPSQIEEAKVAACLDTLLFAAAFEQAGLNPLLVLIDGHALVGLWLQPEDDCPTYCRAALPWQAG